MMRVKTVAYISSAPVGWAAPTSPNHVRSLRARAHSSVSGTPRVVVAAAMRVKSLVELAAAGIRVKGVPCGDNFIWGPEEAVRNLYHDQSFDMQRVAGEDVGSEGNSSAMFCVPPFPRTPRGSCVRFSRRSTKLIEADAFRKRSPARPAVALIGSAICAKGSVSGDCE